jgi:hypothetical protein
MEPQSIQSDLVETRETSAPEPQPDPLVTDAEPAIRHRNIAEWHGSKLIDRDGEPIGKLEDVYFDVETDEPQFGTVKEGLFGRHLTFVPFTGTTIGPNSLQVPVTKQQVKDAPNIERHDLSQADESQLYHHYQLNYTPLDKEAAGSYADNAAVLRPLGKAAGDKKLEGERRGSPGSDDGDITRTTLRSSRDDPAPETRRA